MKRLPNDLKEGRDQAWQSDAGQGAGAGQGARVQESVIDLSYQPDAPASESAAIIHSLARRASKNTVVMIKVNSQHLH